MALTTIGWIDGITASGVVLIGVIFGAFFIYKSRKLEADVLLHIGMVMIFAGLAFCGPENTDMKIFEIKHGNAESLGSIVEGLKSKDGKVTADRNTNTLVVIDYPKNLERIADVIKELDVPVKQVEITVLVTEVSMALFDAIGLSSGQVVIPQSEFGGILRMLETDRDTNIRSRMTVRTLNNEPAKIRAGVDEIFGDTIIRYSDGREVTSFTRESVGDLLEVLPRVNNDGTITITLRPTMSNLEEDGGIYERSVLTSVVIESGDTISIGGVSSARQVTGTEGVAGTGLPLSTISVEEGKRVMMFLTATITER